MYIDNFALALQSQNGLDWLKRRLIQEFNMKNFGKTQTIIGWEITQDVREEILKIDQKGYIRHLLESEKMSLCHPTVFLMKTGSTLTLDQAEDLFPIDMIVYQLSIEKLMYLVFGTRPDIAFIVEQLSCHNSNF